MGPFTAKELFAVAINPYSDPEKGYECWECGAAVINVDKHVEFHNKVADL